MKHFEYEVTKHHDDDFSHLVYFCNERGECSLDKVPAHQTRMLADMLNDRGSDGWELIQMFFGKDGVVMFWKREI